MPPCGFVRKRAGRPGRWEDFSSAALRHSGNFCNKFNFPYAEEK